jgi:hypothetical protein
MRLINLHGEWREVADTLEERLDTGFKCSITGNPIMEGDFVVWEEGFDHVNKTRGNDTKIRSCMVTRDNDGLFYPMSSWKGEVFIVSGSIFDPAYVMQRYAFKYKD